MTSTRGWLQSCLAWFYDRSTLGSLCQHQFLPLCRVIYPFPSKPHYSWTWRNTKVPWLSGCHAMVFAWGPVVRQGWGLGWLSRQIHVATRSNEAVQRSEVLHATHCFYSMNCRMCVGILRSLKDHLSSSPSNVFTVPGMLLLQFSHLLQSTKPTMCAPSLFLEVHCWWQKPSFPTVFMSMHRLWTRCPQRPGKESDLLVVSSSVGPGNWTQVLKKGAQSLNCSAISLGPGQLFH